MEASHLDPSKADHRITYGYFTSGARAARGEGYVKQDGVYVALFVSTAANIDMRLFARALAHHLHTKGLTAIVEEDR